MSARVAPPEPEANAIAGRYSVQAAWVRAAARRLAIGPSFQWADPPFGRGLGDDFTPDVAEALTAAQLAHAGARRIPFLTDA